MLRQTTRQLLNTRLPRQGRHQTASTRHRCLGHPRRIRFEIEFCLDHRPVPRARNKISHLPSRGSLPSTAQTFGHSTERCSDMHRSQHRAQHNTWHHTLHLAMLWTQHQTLPKGPRPCTTMEYSLVCITSRCLISLAAQALSQYRPVPRSKASLSRSYPRGEQLSAAWISSIAERHSTGHTTAHLSEGLRPFTSGPGPRHRGPGVAGLRH